MLLMIEKPRPTPVERGARALSRALDRIVMGPFRALEDRRLLDTMAAMSDHELRDIGLSRGDIRDAVARPGHRDAASSLAGRRHRG